MRAPSLPQGLVQRLRAAGCVHAEEEAQLLLSCAPPHALPAMVERRARGEPLEQVLGWAFFAGCRVRLEPGVFVPRRRSEFLASLAAQHLRAGDVVLDLCCGSGALAMAVAAARRDLPSLQLWACDIDPRAVRCARRNLVPIGGRVVQGDLYDALPPWLQGRVDLVVANAPYVPSAQTALLPREARLHEPAHTFDGGADGLDVQRRIAADASRWLAPGGLLLMETAADAAAATQALLERGGLAVQLARSDDWDATVAVASRAAPRP